MSASPCFQTPIVKGQEPIGYVKCIAKSNAGEETTIVRHVRVLVAVVIVAAKTRNSAVELQKFKLSRGCTTYFAGL
jgi:hypothetical protein